MPSINFFRFIKDYSFKNQPLYLVCLMMLFWSIFDGIMSYVSPLIITSDGLSKTMMGIIIGTSSISGAIFDFLVCRIFKNTYYKRFFMFMFAVCLVYPLILFHAKTIFIYLIAMSLWGIYYDFKNIGNFDYISRYTGKDAHSQSFGLLQFFISIGYLIAPIMVGFILVENVTWKPFALAYIFLIVSITFFLVLILINKKNGIKEIKSECHTSENAWSEMILWGRIGKILFPVLILMLFLNILDSFFWTIGPLLAESLAEIHQFAGFFMTAYSLPALLVGWTIGRITGKFGKKRTAFLSLIVGSFFLSLIYFIQNPVFVILDIFVSSIFTAMAWPAINGAFADYISETLVYEKEIEGIEDFYCNLGYVIGPMTAGFIADMLGNSGAFSLIGVCGMIIGLSLLIFAPKKINLKRELKNAQVQNIS
ncbi:MAG: MFS transporter [Candidatus Buchananbacteria bacterium]